MSTELRKVTQDEWADHLNLQTCYACEPSHDVMEHRVYGTEETIGRVVYKEDGSREYYIPMDAPTVLMDIHARLVHDMAYRFSVRNSDVHNMRIVLRAWGYPYTVQAAHVQITHALGFGDIV